jgi:hypothetical protein
MSNISARPARRLPARCAHRHRGQLAGDAAGVVAGQHQLAARLDVAGKQHARRQHVGGADGGKPHLGASLGVERDGRVVDRQVDLGRLLAGEAGGDHVRRAHFAGVPFQQDLRRAERARQVDPLPGVRHLAAVGRQTARFQVVGQQRGTQVDGGLPGRMGDPGDALAVQHQLDRRHAGARR